MDQVTGGGSQIAEREHQRLDVSRIEQDEQLAGLVTVDEDVCAATMVVACGI